MVAIPFLTQWSGYYHFSEKDLVWVYIMELMKKVGGTLNLSLARSHIFAFWEFSSI